MEQEPLFYEDEIEALKVDIARLGGAQEVGHALWPSKNNPQAAGEQLRNCLNRDRREKLDYEQIIWIKREARKVGSFAAQTYENQECGFAPPVPIEPEDEAAALQRAYVNCVGELGKIANRLERLNLPSIKQAGG